MSALLPPRSGVGPAAAVDALRARRVARRTERIEPFDAFYRAYVTVLLAGLAVLAVSGWVGDQPVTAAGRAEVERTGAAVLGLVSVVAVATGLRSGSRGGPLAVEAADVVHVLLGPVDRGRALRPYALRQVRFLAFAAVVVGAVGGLQAARRMGGAAPAWMVAGAAWAVVSVALAVASAWLAAGLRLRTVVATAVAAPLAAWSVADVVGDVPSAPASFVGRLALWPLRAEPVALAAGAVAAALCVVGLARIDRTSLERLRHRSALVGQLRFAATLHDVRTVMVLRRQLAQEHPRRRPWIRGSRHLSVLPAVVARDVRSLVRTPAGRLARLVGAIAVSVVAAAGAWSGTTALVVVAGLASFVAGLEAVEPLAQEIDHPVLHLLAPVPRGRLLAQHLVVPAGLMTAVGGCGVVAVLAAGADRTVVGVAALTWVPAALAGTAGAAINTVRSQIGDEPDLSGTAEAQLAVPPELTGMRVLYSTALPPAVATLGFAPVLAARRAVDAGLDPVQGATTAAALVLVAVAGVVAWIRYRDEVADWVRRTTEAASSTDRRAAARDGR